MFVSRRGWLGPAILNLIRRRGVSSTGAQPSVTEDVPNQKLGHAVKPFKQPFLKNTLVGKFDNDFLIYPEVVDLQALEERCPLIWNKSEETDSQLVELSPFEKAKYYAKCGVPLAPRDDWKESERVKLYEAADMDIQTALLLEAQTLVIQVISQYGSEYLKSKYLNRLLNGEITGAFALSEVSSGSDPSALETIATHDDEKREYSLTGEKRWVTNGKQADLFLVFAVTDSPHSHQPSDLNVFLVDRTFPKITVTDENPGELRDCGLSRVMFEGTPMPERHLVGECGNGFDLAALAVNRNRYFLITSLLNTMKRHTNDAIQTVLTRKQFPLPLKNCELIQSKIAEMGSSIYALESTLYLHAGMSDLYNIDLSVESATLQLLCFETAMSVFETCNNILGGKSFNCSLPYMKAVAEAKGAFLASKTQSLLQLYTSLTSLQHAGNVQNEMIFKSRNPLDYPKYVFKRMLKSNRVSKGDPELELQLFMNLHPSLQFSSSSLECTVLRLQYAVEVIFSRQGTDLVNRQNDLCRVANVLKDIYAMTAVLARSSRSYCTGIRWCDDEVRAANNFCFDAIHRTRLELSKLIDGGFVSNDVERLKFGAELINKRSYFLEHPSVKNIG